MVKIWNFQFNKLRQTDLPQITINVTIFGTLSKKIEDWFFWQLIASFLSVCYGWKISIILESILTTFELSEHHFWGSGGSTGYLLKPKTKPQFSFNLWYVVFELNCFISDLVSSFIQNTNKEFWKVGLSLIFSAGN